MTPTQIHFIINGTTPYSASRDPSLLGITRGPNESFDEYENRTWKLHAHVASDGESVVIPAHGLHQALELGAQKGRLIPEAAQSQRERLSKRIATGIMLLGDLETNMKLSQAQKVTISAHANGQRGSGSRVPRSFPVWNEWQATCDIIILDETVTMKDLSTAMRWAGLVAGLGRFRPENGGHNGRFTVKEASVVELAA